MPDGEMWQGKWKRPVITVIVVKSPAKPGENCCQYGQVDWKPTTAVLPLVSMGRPGLLHSAEFRQYR